MKSALSDFKGFKPGGYPVMQALATTSSEKKNPKSNGGRLGETLDKTLDNIVREKLITARMASCSAHLSLVTWLPDWI